MKADNDLVINYHVTEKCNYSCRFCYAQWDKPNEIHADGNKAETMLAFLASYFIKNPKNIVQQQMPYKNVRLNFAGGEPMLLQKRFSRLLTVAKNLGFELSLITNGHFLTESFIKQYAPLFSMIGISYDSQLTISQKEIGRVNRKGESISPESLLAKIALLHQVNPNIQIKINTVVNAVNQFEDFNKLITEINPVKWKVLQVLPVENDAFQISEQTFNHFLTRHKKLEKYISAEDNSSMTRSYLMINPEGKFYQNKLNSNGYTYSQDIIETGVEEALQQVEIDWSSFSNRYKKSEALYA
jgi:radical S-adenosyl methionine domain-containing protein 2